MIHGVGTDIVRVARLAPTRSSVTARFAERILDVSEREAFAAAPNPARLLAKRFAAKEAFGKGPRHRRRRAGHAHAVRVGHDALGKPVFEFSPLLAEHMREHGMSPI